MTAELRHRQIKSTRYHEVLLHQNLWGGWIVTRVWGRQDADSGGRPGRGTLGTMECGPRCCPYCPSDYP